jgi:hypothetical protein
MSQPTKEQMDEVNDFVKQATVAMITQIKDERTKASELPMRIHSANMATHVAATLFTEMRELHPRFAEMITLQILAGVMSHFAGFIASKFGLGITRIPCGKTPGFSIKREFDPSAN